MQLAHATPANSPVVPIREAVVAARDSFVRLDESLATPRPVADVRSDAQGIVDALDGAAKLSELSPTQKYALSTVMTSGLVLVEILDGLAARPDATVDASNIAISLLVDGAVESADTAVTLLEL